MAAARCATSRATRWRSARAGLRAAPVANGAGRDETHYLDLLDEIAASGRTPAHDLLDRYHGAWRGSVEPAFEECTF